MGVAKALCGVRRPPGVAPVGCPARPGGNLAPQDPFTSGEAVSLPQPFWAATDAALWIMSQCLHTESPALTYGSTSRSAQVLASAEVIRRSGSRSRRGFPGPARPGPARPTACRRMTTDAAKARPARCPRLVARRRGRRTDDDGAHRVGLRGGELVHQLVQVTTVFRCGGHSLILGPQLHAGAAFGLVR